MIRRATIDDAKAIAEVHVKSWQAAYRGLLTDEFLQNLSVEQRERQWKAGVENLEQVILVYELENIVAFCSFAPSRDPDVDKGKVAELGTIYALESVWGQGIGKQVWDAAIEQMRERKFSEVTLWVLKGNDRAIRFYERMGMTFDGNTKTETRQNGINLHELRYRMELLGHKEL
jgi:ribosomal protein S18 acetylase RimI-like enzyme